MMTIRHNNNKTKRIFLPRSSLPSFRHHPPRAHKSAFPVTASEARGDAAVHPVVDATPASTLVGDSEIIILQLKPSILYIPLSSLGSLFAIAFAALLLAYATTLRISVPWTPTDAAFFGVIVATLRLGWQTLDWNARTYTLTDRRIIVSSGILRRRHFQASLYRIQHIAVLQSVRERIFGLGTIAFATAGSATYDAAWYTISKPFEHHQTIVQAVDRYGGHHPST